MSRSTRRQKSEALLKSLEDQFSTNLITALRECAIGTWGMFGRNDDVIVRQENDVREMLKLKAAKELLGAGKEIERMRRELGLTEPFQPFKRFLEYGQMKGSHVPGEPKLAVQFLEELGAEWP
jgi:hypothetical protein